MVKSRMVLTFDDRRKLAAAYDIFVRVDARRKAVRRSRRKSKPRDESKPRSPTGLWGILSFIAGFLVFMLSLMKDFKLFEAL